jgi:hypothetical protein
VIIESGFFLLFFQGNPTRCGKRSRLLECACLFCDERQERLIEPIEFDCSAEKKIENQAAASIVRFGEACGLTLGIIQARRTLVCMTRMPPDKMESSGSDLSGAKRFQSSCREQDRPSVQARRSRGLHDEMSQAD